MNSITPLLATTLCAFALTACGEGDDGGAVNNTNINTNTNTNNTSNSAPTFHYETPDSVSNNIATLLVSEGAKGYRYRGNVSSEGCAGIFRHGLHARHPIAFFGALSQGRRFNGYLHVPVQHSDG